VIQGFIITSQVVNTRPIGGGTTNVPVVVVSV
jgi:hypothetical protein